MKTVNHKDRDHALLSPSGASRWIACTPSARLEEQYGAKDESSVYAKEGQLAHELAELILRKDLLGTISDRETANKMASIMNDPLFSDEMADILPRYTHFVSDEYNASRTETSDAVLMLEEKVDLSAWIPECFGSCDAIVIGDRVMKVMDLKWGKGVMVSAEGNKQLMLYALGAYEKFSLMYDIKEIEMYIIQPRIDNYSSWTVSVEDLLKWAEDVVRAKAEMAFKGEGELVPGDHCKFCKVKARCKALYEEQMQIAKYEFADSLLLSDEEISDVLGRIPRLVAWANSIEDYAKKEAIDGKVWPGFKLVEGRSVRKISDPEKVEEALTANGFTEDEIYEMKLKSITSLEKLCGKKKLEALIGDFLIKPAGAPCLVPESDKRPALGIEDAINDFK